MKITQLDIKGFRSLKDVTWKPGDLNVLIGANGSGKSNLLRFLRVIATAARGGLAKAVQTSGGMGALAWNGVAPSISFTLKTNPLDPLRDPEQYDLELVRLGMTSAYRVERELLANFARVRTGEKPQPFKHLERSVHRAVVFDEQEQALVAPPETVEEDETLLSVVAGPFINNRRVPAFQQQLDRMMVYHGLDVSHSSPIRQPAVTSNDTKVEWNGQNLVAVLHTLYAGNRDFEREVDLAMRAAFGDDYERLSFPPAADQRTQLRVRWKTFESPAADLSDGTLRFLFLLTVLASPDPPPVIAIDEPETGLHPSMLPIIGEFAADAALRAQVVIATHSPQLLDALSEFRPTTTVMKWAEGATVLQNLNGEELDYWLQDYTLGKLFKSGELEQMG